MICALIFSGLQTIRKWTKESLLEKPFCTAKGKIWTEDPSDTPLDEVYTKLRLLGKIRTKDTVKTEELSDSKDVIVKLGKLSLDGLLQKQPKLSFTKVCSAVLSVRCKLIQQHVTI